MRPFTLVPLLLTSLVFSSSAAAGTYNVELDQPMLQAALATVFPVHGDETFITVQLSEPQVILREGSDRIGVKAMAKVSFPIGNKYSGSTYVDGKLRYEEKTNSLYLDQATVQELDVGKMPDMVRTQVLTIANMVARSVLDKQAIYVFKDDNSAATLIRKQISHVEVKNGKLVIEISTN